MAEGEGDNFYTKTDHLASIGFQAQPGDIYYMNPPKELSSYPMYIASPQKTDKAIGTVRSKDRSVKVIHIHARSFLLFRVKHVNA